MCQWLSMSATMGLFMLDRFNIVCLRAVLSGTMWMLALAALAFHLTLGGGTAPALNWGLGLFVLGLAVAPCAADRAAVLGILMDQS